MGTFEILRGCIEEARLALAQVGQTEYIDQRLRKEVQSATTDVLKMAYGRDDPLLEINIRVACLVPLSAVISGAQTLLDQAAELTEGEAARTIERLYYRLYPVAGELVATILAPISEPLEAAQTAAQHRRQDAPIQSAVEAVYRLLEQVEGIRSQVGRDLEPLSEVASRLDQMTPRPPGPVMDLVQEISAKEAQRLLNGYQQRELKRTNLRALTDEQIACFMEAKQFYFIRFHGDNVPVGAVLDGRKIQRMQHGQVKFAGELSTGYTEYTFIKLIRRLHEEQEVLIFIH